MNARRISMPVRASGLIASLCVFGVLCATGVAPSAASGIGALRPQYKWSSGVAVPKVQTADTVAVEGCSVGPRCSSTGATVYWRALSDDGVWYSSSTKHDSLSGTWTAPKAVPQAGTPAGPAATSFYDSESNQGTFVAWRDLATDYLYYSVNTCGTWTKEGLIPNTYVPVGTYAAVLASGLSALPALRRVRRMGGQ